MKHIKCLIQFCFRPKKKLWKENDKWTHDKYRTDQQAPKTREELIMEYGYDIMLHDQPPAASPQNYDRPRLAFFNSSLSGNQLIKVMSN